MSRISEDRSTIVCPLIDHIDSNTFEYHEELVTWIGFHWNLIMDWRPTPYMDFDATRKNKTEPFPTPMMVGCAFSIDRVFFYEIGSYDSGMHIWGSENLETSLRVGSD